MTLPKEAEFTPAPFRTSLFQALLERRFSSGLSTHHERPARPVVVSAPMAEMTDAAYRVLAFEQGADACWTEMVSAAGLVHDSPNTPPLLETLPEEADKPVIVQLYGSNPLEMAEAVRRVSDLGRFSAIDINAGCPAPKVVRCGGGSALLRDLPLYGRIIAAAVSATNLPVTVKTRIGLSPESNCAAEIAKIAEDSGAALLTLHGRYASAFHSGPLDLHALVAARHAVHIPVLVNGGINSPNAARQILRETDADGVMLARAAIGNPTLFRRTIAALENPGFVDTPPSPDLQRSLFLHHLDVEGRLKSAQNQPDPEHMALLAFRRFLFLYFRGLPGAAALRRRLNALESLDAVRQAVQALF